MNRRSFFRSSLLGMPALGLAENSSAQTVRSQGPIIEGYTGFTGRPLNEIWFNHSVAAERYKICERGWYKPAITLLPNGEVIAAPFRNAAKPGTPQWGEELGIFRSKDGGRSWSKLEAIIPGREVGLKVLKDGTALMTIMVLPGDRSLRSKLFASMIGRSTDGGKTWTTTRLNMPGAKTFETEVYTSKDILELPDGGLMLMVTVGKDRQRLIGSWVYRSYDQGLTWSEQRPVKIASGYSFSEAALLRLPSGRIMAGIRCDLPKAGQPKREGESNNNMRLSYSVDNGVTWSDPTEFGDYSEPHGRFCMLKDGRIFYNFTVRHFPFGAQGWTSSDQGQTWDRDHPVIISWFSWDNFCGYPCTLQLPDGDLLTSYTSRNWKDHPSIPEAIRDQSAEVVRWKAPPLPA